MADLISRATLLFALGLVRFEVLRSICSHMFSVHTIILSLDWFSEQGFASSSWKDMSLAAAIILGKYKEKVEPKGFSLFEYLYSNLQAIQSL